MKTEKLLIICDRMERSVNMVSDMAFSNWFHIAYGLAFILYVDMVIIRTDRHIISMNW